MADSLRVAAWFLLLLVAVSVACGTPDTGDSGCAKGTFHEFTATMFFAHVLIPPPVLAAGEKIFASNRTGSATMIRPLESAAKGK